MSLIISRYPLYSLLVAIMNTQNILEVLRFRPWRPPRYLSGSENSALPIVSDIDIVSIGLLTNGHHFPIFSL